MTHAEAIVGIFFTLPKAFELLYVLVLLFAKVGVWGAALEAGENVIKCGFYIYHRRESSG